jgi:hypothetical protein
LRRESASCDETRRVNFSPSFTSYSRFLTTCLDYRDIFVTGEHSATDRMVGQFLSQLRSAPSSSGVFRSPIAPRDIHRGCPRSFVPWNKSLPVSDIESKTVSMITLSVNGISGMPVIPARLSHQTTAFSIRQRPALSMLSGQSWSLSPETADQRPSPKWKAFPLVAHRLTLTPQSR